MQKACRQCAQQFEITDNDLKFYDKISPVFAGKKYEVPAPTLCPDCRLQRRLTYRNFWNLYHRKCDLTGRPIISMYSPDKPFKVYDQDAWWSDKWDPLEFGISYDPNKSFFEQMEVLFNKVPKLGVYIVKSENCSYSNMVFESKNCYLVFGCLKDENCYYGHIVWHSTDCYDCAYVTSCERCYECVDCLKCYDLIYGKDCENCFDSAFLIDCRSSKNCFGCVGLRNKEYCIFNEQYSKEDYLKAIKKYNLSDPSVVEEIKSKVKALSLQCPVQYIHASNLENCSGDYIYNSKNVQNSFDVKESEDLKFACTIAKFKDSYDVNYSGLNSELIYESIFIQGQNVKFSHLCYPNSANIMYCDSCMSCKDCFGCVGLKNKQYCILNKQYSKEEYEALVPKIIDQMMKGRAHGASAQASEFGSRGPQGSEAEPIQSEWGEFFPIALSPFGYNETMANLYYPLVQEKAKALGAQWKSEEEKPHYKGPKKQIPNDINIVPEDITKEILLCESCGKNYKIIAQELKFYKEMGLGVPRNCFYCRNEKRLAMRNPRKLWNRTCSKCNTPIQTSYAPDRPEKVYCESCYLKEVY